MLESLTCNRRTMLRVLGSTLAIVSLSLMSPVKSVAKALRRLTGPLGLLPLHHHAIRRALCALLIVLVTDYSICR